MKLTKLLLAGILSVTIANAEDVMQKSMSTMAKGMSHIQLGFMNNDISLIKSGSALVEEGNKLFSEKEVIKEYLPKDKKHMINVAENQAKRISLDVSVMNLQLDDKSFINAANAYSDILNACSRCHAIVRNW